MSKLSLDLSRVTRVGLDLAKNVFQVGEPHPDAGVAGEVSVAGHLGAAIVGEASGERFGDVAERRLEGAAGGIGIERPYAEDLPCPLCVKIEKFEERRLLLH